ncbi:MAG: FAD-binding protein [Thermodesulfobacteriota bacterium]
MDARAEYAVLDTDVLVIGGGLTGCWAAIQARRKGASVILMDKGQVGTTGCGTFSCGNIACPFPEDDISLWERELFQVGRGLSDKGWVRTCLSKIPECVQDMQAFGVQFERRGERLIRSGGRGKLLKSVIAPARPMMKAMRKYAQDLGVDIHDRFIALDLAAAQGRCQGAVAMHTRRGDFLLVKAGATVLAAGGCGFGGTFYGQQFSTGDAHRLAYRVGVMQTGFEFVSHNTTHRDYDTSGMGRFVGQGGKFINGLGQPFMERYDKEFGDRAPLNSLFISMAEEVKAGRGPIYLDLTSMSALEHERFLRVMPHMGLIFSRAGIYPRKEPMPWLPMSGSTYGMATGCWVDLSGHTSFPGLFAAGGAGGMLKGAAVGVTGAALMSCCVSGYVAGDRAAQHALGAGPVGLDREMMVRTRVELLEPLEAQDGISYHRLLEEIQRTLFPYDVMILKRADRLKSALGKIVQLGQEEAARLSANDIHEAVRCWEVKNVLLSAEMFLRASLARTESRGNHFREDFPAADDEGWLKYILIRLEEGKMSLALQPLPESGS